MSPAGHTRRAFLGGAGMTVAAAVALTLAPGAARAAWGAVAAGSAVRRAGGRLARG